MKTEEITYEDACRIIANQMVNDVKIYPERSVRFIVNSFWGNLPRLQAYRTQRILNLFRETNLGTMATFYAEVEVRECIYEANKHGFFGPGEERSAAFMNKVVKYALGLKESQISEEE
tara:strand:- start:312 stop:665 length:354 start_codon:yes stop_codon:yes gene_type:complete